MSKWIVCKNVSVLFSDLRRIERIEKENLFSNNTLYKYFIVVDVKEDIERFEINEHEYTKLKARLSSGCLMNDYFVD